MSSTDQKNILVGSAALFVVLVGLAIAGLLTKGAAYFFSSKSKRKGNTVLLLGPCGAGKTLLWLQLRDGKAGSTHTSMTDNDQTFAVPNNAANGAVPGKAVRVIDVAGHERLRARVSMWLRKLTKSGELACIVFVIDADHFEARPAALLLYQVLSAPQLASLPSGRQVPILIACNKSDRLDALPPTRIEKALAKDMHEEREARRNGVHEANDDRNGGEHEAAALVGLEGQPFSFQHVLNPVSFAACSAQLGQLEPIRQFITRNVAQ